MPRYRYTARTKTGEELHGELTAGSEVWARQSLESAELEVVTLESCERPIQPAGSVTPESPSTPQDTIPKLSTAQATQLASHLRATTAAGLPLEDTLDALATDCDDPHLASAVRHLASRLRDGVPLEQAISMLDRQLPRRIRGLLEAGVRCGNPAGIFEAFARQQIVVHTVAQKVASTMVFPLFILLVAGLITLFMALYVVPMFEDLFRDFDLQLPALTMIALMLAHALPAAFLVALVVFASLWALSRLGTASSLVCQLRSTLPVLGKLWTFAGHQELASALATLVALRIPLPESLAYAGNLIGDANLARACRKVSAQASAGMSLSECMARSIHFDRMLTALVRWGEEHGLAAAALEHADRFYAERVDQQAALVRRTLPPIILVTVVMMAGLMLISLFLPLINLIEGLA
jgi:type IV pilus assembly protein PilC